MSFNYNLIYDFCAVKNTGGAHKNGILELPNRVKWIISTLDSLNIKYELDEFTVDRFGDNKFYNIILKGSSSKMVTAHHDVVNVASDNANDNSASVINAIATKYLNPSVNVVILDGEECPMFGVGSTRCAFLIKQGYFGGIDWVLNLELTGKGGDYFFIGSYRGPLTDLVKSKFEGVPVVHTPFNDADIFVKYGIDSIVINPIPPIVDKTKTSPVFYRGEYLDFSLLHNCHSMKDSVDTISPDDMKIFTEKIICEILN